jgi:hypothetical protein
MPAPTRRGPEQDEQVLSMADYQRAINQGLHWPHFEGETWSAFPIAELHPARATNALHKLRRWQHALFDGATEALYDQARTTLYASPLVAALIEQALGEFYAGTYLRTEEVPHVDEIAQRREANETNELGQARMKDALMVISIDVLSTEVGERLTFGQRAVMLRDRLFDYLTDKKEK